MGVDVVVWVVFERVCVRLCLHARPCLIEREYVCACACVRACVRARARVFVCVCVCAPACLYVYL